MKFYARYVDDTLFVIKREGVRRIQNLLNNYDPNLRFTVDFPHFLDLELSSDGISVFRKNTNTGLYTHFSSYVPWTHKTAWIKSLTSRASCICSPNKLSSEINFIKKLASWSGFPILAIKRIIHQVLNTTGESTNNAESPEILTIYLCMPYYSHKGLSLLKSCLRKIRSNCVKTCSTRFKTQYDVNKIEFFCNTEDKTAVLSNSFVVYDFSCPGCGANYIGKTGRILSERTVEHAWTDNNSAVYKHLDDCVGVQHLFDIAFLHSSLFTSSAPIQNSGKFDLQTLVQGNTETIDRHKNWNILLFREALKINELNPILNSGLKGSKELLLF